MIKLNQLLPFLIFIAHLPLISSYHHMPPSKTDIQNMITRHKQEDEKLRYNNKKLQDEMCQKYNILIFYLQVTIRLERIIYTDNKNDLDKKISLLLQRADCLKVRCIYETLKRCINTKNDIKKLELTQRHIIEATFLYGLINLHEQQLIQTKRGTK